MRRKIDAWRKGYINTIYLDEWFVACYRFPRDLFRPCWTHSLSCLLLTWWVFLWLNTKTLRICLLFTSHYNWGIIGIDVFILICSSLWVERVLIWCLRPIHQWIFKLLPAFRNIFMESIHLNYFIMQLFQNNWFNLIDQCFRCHQIKCSNEEFLLMKLQQHYWSKLLADSFLWFLHCKGGYPNRSIVGLDRRTY